LGLELGGNEPFLIFDDADIEAVVDGVMASKFRNGGQTCVCANRLLVQSGVYDALVERLARAITTLRVGDGRAEGTTIGPMINSAAIAKIERHVADAKAKGARITLGGGRRRRAFSSPRC
jgi:succinate-semialdehyde dehydrogenase / glutarate-semialdehyde dehydrogenase